MAHIGGVFRLGTTQTAAYTSVAAAISTAISTGTNVVRVSTTTGAYIKFGATPTAAATNSAYIAGGMPEYFVVTPGQKVSAVRAATSGTMTVTEVS
jgi:hypothetical protein